MKNLSVFIIAFLLVGLNSCEKELFACLDGTGEVELRVHDLPFFNKINLKIDGDVFITEGPELEVQIEGPAKVIDRIIEDSEVVNEEWVIDLKACSNNSKVKFLVTMPELKALNIAGQGLMQTEGIFNNIDQLSMGINGSGDMNIQVGEANKLEVKISGDGKVTLSGATQEKDININGEGTIRAFDLVSQVTHIKVSGDGDCETLTEAELNVDFNGTGLVCYKGNPVLNLNSSGDGVINNCN